MKRILLALALAALSAFAQAQAAPWSLYSQIYPSTVVQPTAATFTINGGAPITCPIPAVTGGVQIKCPLSSITAFGAYTFVMTATNPAACINAPDQATCSLGGPVSSNPFAWTYSSGLANKPIPTTGP